MRSQDISNLVKVHKTNNSNHSKSVKFGFLDVRSVVSDVKAEQISDFVVSEELDCLAMTETWL